MNKMYKMIATTSILAMTIIPLTANAQQVPPPTIHNGQGLIQYQAKVVPATMGLITNFVNDKSGKFITVLGRGLAVNDQSEMVLSITKDTKIIDSKGNKVALKTIMDEKRVVKAFYGGNITRSLPAQGTALTLVVQDYTFLGINGVVSEVNEDSIVVNGTDLYSSNEETVILRFANKAQIIDQNGKVIKANKIEPGMSVKAFYGPATTKSIPPQSTSNYILVNTVIEENAIGTDGIITNVTDDRITVIGNPMEKGGTDYVILSVDEKTKIVDEDGKILTKSDLKNDIRVDAYYDGVMTMIYPAQTHADKIVVKAMETNKVEGTIVASSLTSEGQVYIDINTDKSTSNDIILNISDKTKVISMYNNGADLKVGMKITAYHESAMTFSLPGITNAEIVIVNSDFNTENPQ
ncbi:MAG: peptidase [Candidatus Pristimantibacillus lignocellulolyticus]|uniref:Peptidase n=1 Tax=Candidatus Pristimantibacillus lignocellulolyticus TaxID=2994561 RepID=A0A9J6ZG92_9BACL|nr:MAG: peptidase [Candidatus Pristimantibacillus lignocellulolyticus]